MKTAYLLVLVCLFLTRSATFGQGTTPTFHFKTGQSSVTLPGRDPAQGGITVIPTVLVPVRVTFEANQAQSNYETFDAAADVQRLLQSPVFIKASFDTQSPAQYMDALLRATVGQAPIGWHTLLRLPEIRPVAVKIPAGYGYVLKSKRTATKLAMVDVEYIQREIFRQIPRLDGKLVIAMTSNTAYYTYGDATVCCTWGTHGVDKTTGNSFILASYLGATPPLVHSRDVQALTEQLAEWMNDPLHDPLFHIALRTPLPDGENIVPRWKWPKLPGSQNDGCGGDSPATRYTLSDPTDTNIRSDLQAGPASVVRARGTVWHLANVALLGWYTGSEGPYSFPDSSILREPAVPCDAYQPPLTTLPLQPAPPPATPPVPSTGANNGHRLIGYWTGTGPSGTVLRLRDVSPQWDVIIVAFADVNHQAPEGTLKLHVRPGIDLAQMKEDIAWLKLQGKKVLISLGGGGEYFTLVQPASISNFVTSVTQIVTEYGFEGVDIDFESPSLALDPSDKNFRHPTTPSIVNLIDGLQQLRQRIGAGFMLTLVPEGTQIPAAYPGYGGQFGTYLPLLWGIRDILSFVDIQDYNTPPLQGLDGEIYQLGSVDYDAAMTELLLNGFAVGKGADFFPPVAANRVAVGFLVGTVTPELASGAMQYLITGKAPKGVTYRLRRPGGYPDLIGAMFWTIDADRLENHSFSNTVGPQLRKFPNSTLAH